VRARPCVLCVLRVLRVLRVLCVYFCVCVCEGGGHVRACFDLCVF
jgi:hypothetical protein